MENFKRDFEALVQTYGPEKIKAVTEELFGKISKPIPAEHIPVLSPQRLEDTLEQLDSAVNEVLTAGQAVDQAYKDKSSLLKRRAQLETDIKITEASAIMDIRGEARSQYVMIGGEKVALTNDTARDAYRRMASKEQREELAQVEGDIAAIDVELEKAKENRNTMKEANDSIRAKGNIQAALLNFLR